MNSLRCAYKYKYNLNRIWFSDPLRKASLRHHRLFVNTDPASNFYRKDPQESLKSRTNLNLVQENEDTEQGPAGANNGGTHWKENTYFKRCSFVYVSAVPDLHEGVGEEGRCHCVQVSSLLERNVLII